MVYVKVYGFFQHGSWKPSGAADSWRSGSFTSWPSACNKESNAFFRCFMSRRHIMTHHILCERGYNIHGMAWNCLNLNARSPAGTLWPAKVAAGRGRSKRPHLKEQERTVNETDVHFGAKQPGRLPPLLRGLRRKCSYLMNGPPWAGDKRATNQCKYIKSLYIIEWNP